MYQNKTFVLVLLLIIVGVTPAFASDPLIWDIGSRAELLKGEARGISINDAGLITLAPEATQVFNPKTPKGKPSGVSASMLCMKNPRTCLWLQ